LPNIQENHPMLKYVFVAAAALCAPAAHAAEEAAKPTAAKTAPPPAKPSDAVKAEPGKSANNPKVIVHTSMGDITLELNADKAPKTVENFLQYTKEGFYNGTVFHRVIGNFMIQGGGFGKDLTQKRTRPAIRNEANNGLSNLRGTVAMARTGDPHSATAQFFVNVVNNKTLDFVNEQTSWGYCVFGKVIAGMDVVDQIKAVPTAAQGPFAGDVPTTAIVIEKVEIMQ
jgi:peptidyl-prolyl cis-trans isomerase A (cyclophilin A)